jgi:hypothetical protein
LSQRYRAYLTSLSEDYNDDETEENLKTFFEPIEAEEAALLTFPFAEWIKTHNHDDDETFNVAATKKESPEQDPKKVCPYIASKEGDSAVPSDHPSIPGVDFSDPEAIKACPFLSSKNAQEKGTSTTEVPADHPSIPGVNFADPKAAEACPFLSAKKGND